MEKIKEKDELSFWGREREGGERGNKPTHSIKRSESAWELNPLFY